MGRYGFTSAGKTLHALHMVSETLHMRNRGRLRSVGNLSLIQLILKARQLKEAGHALRSAGVGAVPFV